MAEPTGDTCPHCRGRGWVTSEQGGVVRAKRCACFREMRLEERLAAAGVPNRYLECRLDGFKLSSAGAASRDQLVGAVANCRRYVDGFLQSDGRFCESGLIFVGPPGVGKTHLAVAVLRELVESYRLRARFVDFTALVHDIQHTFDPEVSGTKLRLIDPICKAELVVLDELGGGSHKPPSAWVSEILYLIMNTRYAERRPTLFTTNYRLSRPVGDAGGGMPSAPLLAHRIPAMLVSRLFEVARPVHLDAVSDYREMILHPHLVSDS